MKLKSFNPSTLQLTLNQQKPLYAYINDYNGSSADSTSADRMFLDPPINGFADRIRKKEKMNDQ